MIHFRSFLVHSESSNSKSLYNIFLILFLYNFASSAHIMFSKKIRWSILDQTFCYFFNILWPESLDSPYYTVTLLILLENSSNHRLLTKFFNFIIKIAMTLYTIKFLCYGFFCFYSWGFSARKNFPYYEYLKLALQDLNSDILETIYFRNSKY